MFGSNNIHGLGSLKNSIILKKCVNFVSDKKKERQTEN